jgi:aspartyl-tRNA(Asn)/glutamyl-tRNA(Gln) amidotransferase subunit A
MPETRPLHEGFYFLPVRELGTRIRRRQLSPVALTEGVLDRLERIGPRFNAVVTVMRDSALAEARAAEREIATGRYRGPLHGIPYGVKDLVATRGVPTTWGAAPYREQAFDYDATAVTRLREKGAVLCAKLAMVELAGGMGYNHADASFTGPGLTPWNTGFWSGGSSSGPGAAVAAGLVPFAIGSETSGSILTPSAFSGVTGLRPTYGLVSRHGAMALCWTLDKLGPMGRTADDCALVLSAIAGRDPADESTVDRRFDYADPAPIAKRPRLAIPKGVTEKVQPEVRENFNRAIEVLKPVAEITTDVEWPDFPWGPAVSAIVGAEGAAAFLDLVESGRVKELRCPKDRHGGYAGMLIPAVDYLQAMRLRRPMKRAVAELFQRFDAVVSPTRATVAYPANQNFEDVYPNVSGGPALIPAGNLCGLPALCVPNGLGENQLPTSIAFMGPAFSERDLVALGAWYQSKTRWHLDRPPGV